jgi:hypothetical protein
MQRRAEVLRLAHNVHGGHMSYRKSRDRIRYSFYWPTLKTDLLRHLQCCFECQTRARVTCYDRAYHTDTQSTNSIYSLGYGLFWSNSSKSEGRVSILSVAVLQRYKISMGPTIAIT